MGVGGTWTCIYLLDHLDACLACRYGIQSGIVTIVARRILSARCDWWHWRVCDKLRTPPNSGESDLGLLGENVDYTFARNSSEVCYR